VTYKDTEIMARVHYTGQKLMALNDDGSLDTKTETFFEMEHEDEEVVWYEAEGFENIVTPYDNSNGFFDDIDDAKRAIDWYVKKIEKEYRD
jgi:hypothetical protein